MSNEWEFHTWSDKALAKLQRNDGQARFASNDCLNKQTREAADEDVFSQKHYEPLPPGFYCDEIGDEDWSDKDLAELTRPGYPAHKPEGSPEENKPENK
jgi:hypothetical protein